jgi:hypothetical protein
VAKRAADALDISNIVVDNNYHISETKYFQSFALKNHKQLMLASKSPIVKSKCVA